MRRYVTLFSTGALALAALAPASAWARSEDDSSVLLVSVSNLDLTLARDRKLLDQRIRSAAARVCSDSFDAPPYLWDHCYADAMQSARRQRDELIWQQNASRIVADEAATRPGLLQKIAQYGCKRRADVIACDDVQPEPSEPARRN